MAGKTAHSGLDRDKPEDLRRDRGGRGGPERSKDELDQELDRALQDSFPSSDPPAVSQPVKPGRAGKL